MLLSQFSYDLPDQLIARYPTAERSASRLLHLSRNQDTLGHHLFSDVVAFLNPTDLLVFNDTRVIPARLWGKKETGGQVEILIEKILNNHKVTAHVRASKSPKPGSKIFLTDDISFTVLGRHDHLFELGSETDQPILDIIETLGQIPLPPYFKRTPDESDKERYQTIYATAKGSVAAPTAGLHFDEKLFAALHHKGIETAFLTLHVGAGTFAPVRVEQITQHQMHPEYLNVSADLCEKINRTKQRGGRVVAVGTTTARSLETASLSGQIQPFCGETTIFIYPGFQFNCVDALITNFHLPESTLLMLVSALVGYEKVMAAYREAVQKKYRFFSYGDAMFIV